MSFVLTLWLIFVVAILVSLVMSVAFQIRTHRAADRRHVELRRQLDEQRAELAANRERVEQRTQQLREMQRESLELKRKEVALREEFAASLRQLVVMHEALLAALRGQRPS